jgi:hypothetical protein
MAAKSFTGSYGGLAAARREREIRRREQQRVAVGCGLLDVLRADETGGPRLVLDDDRLAEELRHLVRDDAADEVRRPAGGNAITMRIGLLGRPRLRGNVRGGEGERRCDRA